ncbi:unnamed protein product [Chilo suppressalis]|uniref:phosphatidylinositol-3,5-bisphosphate 3-phosphatase n=1 Tax=Chilo suppressalis TaxID=168631 RepID=A0ABN8B3W3_CHISP|nr:unnamed protein product [Chilo suppressalis]
MLINTYLDTEDFVHLYYPEDEAPAPAQGCGAGARMASKYPARPPSPEYSQVSSSAGEMSERERYRAPPQPEPPPHRVRAADLYPRQRTHYDEPGLDAGFTPICGEFVQWVGRMADGGTIAMSNYRLHMQPKKCTGPGPSVPTRLIDAVEIQDLLHLIVLCKHGRQLKATFATGDLCVEWWRRLNTALVPISSVQETFAAAYAAWAKEQPPASVHRALMRASHAPHRHWFGPEVERLSFTSRGAWRVTAANADYKLCPSYPPLLVVPASIGDEDLDSVARFRAMRRIPAVVWRHRGNGAVIARSSQPEVGWLGWRSDEDERLLAAFVAACNADRGSMPSHSNKQLKLLIVDARSYASAVTNRARGGGCECQQYYPAADIQFMSLPNIHHVRRSFQQMRALAAEPSDQPNWHVNLERTLWAQYVCGVVRAACVVVRGVLDGRPALVHCSDGWDRTPQIVATAQLLLDPHYRTRQGFRTLIEREWLDFGHKFADRCGHQFGPEEPNERSPIFLQWLDVTYQLMLQHPCHFEFNEAYLLKLATHVHSCMFGTFLCNTGRERAENRIQDTTAHVWHLLQAPPYRNHLYAPLTDQAMEQQVLWPDCSVLGVRVWTGLFSGERDEPERTVPPPPRPETHNGLMTKTRSCDNLLNESEKRTTQRRCSDPSLAPDVMKLSVVGTECESLRVCRGTLTDSCVDELPGLTPSPIATDQVDGLHPDHFENSNTPRDITSGSSSLERELGPQVDDPAATRAADTTDSSDPTDAADPTDVTIVTPEVDSPEEPAVFIGDAYTDVLGIADAARETGRTRNISITWRSISESSNQSSNGFDLADRPATSLDQLHDQSRDASHEPSPDNQLEADRANHNLLELTNGNGTLNGVNGLVDVTTKFLEVELNGGTTSSSVSSESEGETGATRRAGRRHGSQLTLCPASPRRCCRCSRAHSTTSGIETSGDSLGEACWCYVAVDMDGEPGGRARCVCGAGASGGGAGGGGGADPLDGLPVPADPTQARLHQIILQHQKVVEELSGQLREARELLRRASPHAAAPPLAPAAAPAPPVAPPQKRSTSGSGTGSASNSSGGSSGSAFEVEVGEEARGVVWLPDSAASRCQHCSNHFWLARRRHHCRRCGGIFCSSCSQLSPWGECGAVRVCHRCRALR